MHLDSVQEEYAELAPRYDGRWAFYVETTVQKTLDRLALQGDERILDLGCGTGALLQRLVALAPETTLIGVDLSAPMLAVARQKLPEAVELHVGKVESLPFAQESFDRVISTSAFHYFREPAQALQAIKRVLKPGGVLVITDWCNDYWTSYGCDLVLRLVNQAHFRAYRTSQYHEMLQASGFANIVIEKYKIDWFWGMMTATAAKADRVS
jgi:ubiquinone/menaquinone biosynthesis C-methylase UbiE